MSKDIEIEVWDYSQAKAATKLVLLCIADSAALSTRVGVIDPEQVAHRCKIEQRWVFYNLNKLEEIGEIEKVAPSTYRIRNYIAKGGYLDGQQLNVYPEHIPPAKGSIKDRERRQALQEQRAEIKPRPRRRRK